MIPHLRLRDLVVDTARDHGIPIQFDVLPGGGADAGKIPTASTGVPIRSRKGDGHLLRCPVSPA